MSTFAFGTYRVSDENLMHIEALKEAIEAGIRLIDTSTNYSDGGAERAIAKAMGFFEDEIRNEIKIVSKFGYIQGSNLAAHKETPFEDVVEYSPSCYHSISRSFLKRELTQSLKRLQLNKIDCYLIHNPEYFLYKAIEKKMPREEMLEQMSQRIFEAFIGLEEEVKKGRIDSYGISSNSFAKPQDAEDFLPYENLLSLAEKAAKKIGSKGHSFTTVEFPLNLLEREGLACAAWAKKNGLRVLTNRPLNAQKESLMYRLAEYDEPKEYYHTLNELLEICDNEQLKPLYNLIEQMDMNKHKFGFIGEYDTFLYTQILPHIKKAIENVHQDVLDVLLEYIDRFLREYREMVAYESSKLTKTALKEYFEGCDAKMQECALRFLLEIDDIDYIIVGMRKPSYVQEVMALS
ncbi:MAG TPA: aldo/keto reductase [Sulfurimonas autotrophica]|uniref:Aldo/keto reductase n=1 Tax=Sulfurimonas autotrophica TaxID=202747 RepID=A0A7C3C8M2_9BACT|nr:aldo/keto reductase [Sulfurimonas autotrophica]